jgi:hypothetical protein
MPRVIIMEEIPNEYVSKGEMLDAFIGELNVTLSNCVAGSSTFMSRRKYHEMVVKGWIKIVPPDTPVTNDLVEAYYKTRPHLQRP